MMDLMDSEREVDSNGSDLELELKRRKLIRFIIIWIWTFWEIMGLVRTGSISGA